MDIETMKAQVELAAIAIREKDLRADKLADTIQQQAERIRELEDKKAANNALCVRRIAEVTAERNEARQQLSEVVEYAGKLRKGLQDYKNGNYENPVQTLLALPLPKAMQEGKN